MDTNKEIMSSSQSSLSTESLQYSEEERDPIRAYGGEFLPYQDEPLASADDSSESIDMDDDRPEDEDGIPPATLRRRFNNEIPLQQW